MLAAIREISQKIPVEYNTHTLVAEYLEACNLIFENGILSHEIISRSQSSSLDNMHKGMRWFFEWKEELRLQDAGTCD